MQSSMVSPIHRSHVTFQSKTLEIEISCRSICPDAREIHTVLAICGRQIRLCPVRVVHALSPRNPAGEEVGQTVCLQQRIWLQSRPGPNLQNLSAEYSGLPLRQSPDPNKRATIRSLCHLVGSQCFLCVFRSYRVIPHLSGLLMSIRHEGGRGCGYGVQLRQKFIEPIYEISCRIPVALG